MGRDLTACGRYAPTPKHQPLSFYTAVRLGDPEFLAKVMSTDPYFVTQARRCWGCRSGGAGCSAGPSWGLFSSWEACTLSTSAHPQHQ